MCEKEDRKDDFTVDDINFDNLSRDLSDIDLSDNRDLFLFSYLREEEALSDDLEAEEARLEGFYDDDPEWDE